jgi:integrase
MARKSISPATFWLRDPKATKATPIHCMVSFDGMRIKVSTPFKCLPSHWNPDKYRVRNVADALDKDQINAYLSNLEKAVVQILADLRSHGIALTQEVVRSRVEAYMNPVVEENKPRDLIAFIKWYIDTSPTRLVRGSKARAGRFISPDTIRRYKTTLNGLEAFAKRYPRTLDFDNIDAGFYKSFTAWLTARNYATNNVSKYVENVKGFMSAAVDEGLTSNMAFRKFANLREEAENIYLTETELSKIYELDLSDCAVGMSIVRDLFIFAAWTGLRFSDFSTLQPEHLKRDENNNMYLELRQRKTGGRVQIPVVHEVVTTLLKKYDNCLPAGLSNQRTNDYLKEICKKAGINDRVLKHMTKGGKSVVKTSDGYSSGISAGVEKWELVTSHTARRSFATNMFKRGMPTLLIMKLTGHKKESEFLKYIKIEASETLDLMRQYLGQRPVQESVMLKIG